MLCYKAGDPWFKSRVPDSGIYNYLAITLVCSIAILMAPPFKILISADRILFEIHFLKLEL